MILRTSIVVGSLAVALAGTAGAQDPMALKRDWERSKKNVVAYVQAMPETATDFQPTPGVRTFAQQFEHIVASNAEIAAVTLKGMKAGPVLGDSAKYLHNKAALVAYVTASYDYVLAALSQSKPADFGKSVSVWDLPAQPVGRWLEMSLEHSVWTLGQVVPYLRLKGATPPSYDIPF